MRPHERRDREDERDHLQRAERMLVWLRWLGMASWFFILDRRDFTASPMAVYAVYGVSVVYTLATHVAAHRAVSARAVVTGAIATTLLDGVIVAGICAVTGGLASDFYPYFYLITIATSIRFGAGAGAAVLAVNALFALLLFAAVSPPEGRAIEPRELGLRVFYLLFATILGGFLAREARRNLRLAQGARDRARDVLRRLIGVQEEERKRIAGEIHDRMGTRFFELHHGVDRARELAGAFDPEAVARLERLAAEARACGAEIRSLMDELRPSVLDDFGVREAVRAFAATLPEQLEVDLTLDPEAPAPRPEVGVALFRILQEAVLNARKHAAPKRIGIALERHGEMRLRLEVSDDGIGFEPPPRGAAGRAGYGLLTMRERAEACGGVLEIESAPGAGTRVRAIVPLAPPDVAGLGGGT